MDRIKVNDPVIKSFRIPEPLAEDCPVGGVKGLVSVVIPTYNMDVTVGQAIQSVLNQDYQSLEVIVIDDGSTDNTRAIVKGFLGDKRVKYYYQENMNTANALNKGIKKSRGEYICWLSADDYYCMNDAVSKRLKVLEDKSIDFVHSDCINIDGVNKNEIRMPVLKTKVEAYNFHRIKLCYVNGSTLMMRRKVIYNIGLFNYMYRYHQDNEYWTRLLWYHQGVRLADLLVERTNTVNLLGQEVMTTKGGNALWRAENDYVGKQVRFLEDSGRPKICAMICMKDESRLIEHCLDDLVQWVDKIVIFDDGSIDDCVQRAKKYDKVVDIFESKNKNNIRTEGKDRQKLLEMALSQGCQWVLFVDIDEVFEHRIKIDIVDLIRNDNVNLYGFKEVNFWHCFDKYRVDELYYKGWFGRLFRSFPFLKMYDQKEHCGGIPVNIPDAQPWEPGGKHKRSDIRVKHYGFAYAGRVLRRAMERIERDAYDPKTGRGGWGCYGRMLDDTGIELRDYEGDSVYAYMNNIRSAE